MSAGVPTSFVHFGFVIEPVKVSLGKSIDEAFPFEIFINVITSFSESCQNENFLGGCESKVWWVVNCG